MRLFQTSIVLALLSLFICPVAAQTGVSVSPPRLYFEINEGHSSTQKVVVTNVSTNHALNLAVSLNDWAYDLKGENITYAAGSLPNSCAGWITIKEADKYFSLKPGELKEIEVTITTPDTLPDSIGAHTALLFVTQMNPVNDMDYRGTDIKVSVRSGIKIFHKTVWAKNKRVEIKNLTFDKEQKNIVLTFDNIGTLWCDGTIYTDLLNTETGKKIPAQQIVFYTMPGNKRETRILLPENLEKGKYTATIIMDYGIEDIMEVAELTFSYE